MVPSYANPQQNISGDMIKEIKKDGRYFLKEKKRMESTNFLCLFIIEIEREVNNFSGSRMKIASIAHRHEVIFLFF